MKVLLVLGSNLPIPPTGWGGIENLVWQQKCALEDAGHQVTIFNKKARGMRKIGLALRSRPWRYDVVHLHKEANIMYWLPVSRCFRFRLVISTHNGYAAFPEHWIKKYQRIFAWIKHARYLILISPEIKETFTRLGCRARMYVIPNGTDCAKIRFIPRAEKQAICLGKIELRKKQAYLAQALDNDSVQCDFVGPIGEPDGFVPNRRNTRFLGSWTREQVNQHLTEYACLVLLSDGEGHAAVVLEAMAAGLSLVLSREASHNLELSHPWIYIVDRDADREKLGDVIARAVEENPRFRDQIRQYCRETFDWAVILPQYVHTLETIIGDGRKMPQAKTLSPSR